jgi:beta-glucosidase
MRSRRFIVCLLVLLCSVFTQSQNRRLPIQSGSVEDRVNSLLSKMTLEEKLDYIGGVNRFYIRAIDRLGIPELKMADGPAGVRNYGPSTTFGGIGLAATWDPQLVRRMAMEIGRDARARGVHFLLGPGVNIHRAPMGGRDFEYFGEDPFLAARTTVAYINGVQSQGVIATVKHFAGNNSEFDRHNTDSIIDERTLREMYLPAFEAAVREAHVGAIMDSYNLLNGEHATENPHLNIEIAKRDWGFDGVIMSDWDATYDGVAAANGGLDLEMPAGKFMNRANLLPAIQAGRVPEDTINDKVRRILRKAIQFKFLDRDQTELSIPLYNREAREVALEAARSSMVLLKNDGNLLPLDKAQIKTIAIVGANAYPTPPVGGGSAKVVPFSTVSYLEGLTNYLGSSATVLYQRGLPEWNDFVQATEFTSPTGEPGLKAEYFASTDLSGSSTATRTDRRLDFISTGTGRLAWPGNAGNNASARWTGTFKAKTSSTYDVMVNGARERSGYRLWLDDKLVIDQWENGVAALNYASVPMKAGSTHAVKLEYWRKRAASIALAIAETSTMVDAQAKAIATQANAVVVAAGFEPSIETEDVDRSFRLPPGQDELIEAMLAANKKVIVVMTSGGNVDSSQWVARVPAYLQAWYAGQESGTALAQLLFGDVSPSGRLPVTFEKRWEDNATHGSYYPQQGREIKYTEGVFVGYRHFDQQKIQPLFPFGFGLTYTSFAYKNLTIGTPDAGGNVTVSFDVTNTGQRPAAEVAQVYVGDAGASVPRPPKELKGFEKVQLNAGETRKVEITLDRRAFQWYDQEKRGWADHPGGYQILIGKSAGQIELRGTVTK